jgi:hypothetical protein
MKDNQHEQLFTELTSEEAAVVEGGALVLSTTVNFDTLLYSRPFRNNVGTKIETDLATRGTGAANPSNKYYGVFLQRLTGGIWNTILQFTEAPINGAVNIVWPNLRPGDHLRLMFSDENDGKKITGSLKVYD